jgi:hypothetical protein
LEARRVGWIGDFLYCLEDCFIVMVVLIPAFFFVAKTIFYITPAIGNILLARLH